ncbi:hypothetical protein VFPPC_16048 [Pochonia chlamydosporia 170]|uniref:Uncharacterized protein n=1 Tax=Pochonia chlamydosporia 170 TaxID=1380566 RepID=A0A179FNE8_METCM|nr:hypothetical protein VFPPC_16048 [Pochonia chlamydosporia 170]OAQ66593.1 hypothetical protein VFPPC_16048 [Pochonia chlamydosporia 170]
MRQEIHQVKSGIGPAPAPEHLHHPIHTIHPSCRQSSVWSNPSLPSLTCPSPVPSAFNLKLVPYASGSFETVLSAAMRES